MPLTRLRIEARGAVQGVGFRPTVYRYAVEAGLAGFVSNDSTGVTVEVEGSAEACAAFTERLRAAPPPAAAVSSFVTRELPPTGETGFFIRESGAGEEPFISIPPDLDVCADCARELFDPADRRWRYPFINCTNCGPRFTITKSMPYDRPGTTMARFPLCADCASEYANPLDRRFHAQPVACPHCGPRVWLESPSSSRQDGADALAAARRLLAEGGILAVRGVGGFHLACDATNARAVGLLRERKKRPAKPFAVMCPDVEAAAVQAELSDAERKLLLSPARPIVLARSRGGGVTELVAPGSPRVGVMLPCAPLQMLLFEPAGASKGGDPPRFPALVMTSGNRRDEPICRSNDEARRRLAGIADAWLLHDREIHNRADDSIVCHAAGAARVSRRSRGFVPRPVRLFRDCRGTILGVGAEIKGGFCLLRGTQAYMSQYLGELSEAGNVGFYREALERFIALLGEPPQVIAHDMHPDYFTTRLAASWPAELHASSPPPKTERLIPVQHHHAHALSVLAELGDAAPARSLAVVLDGTGWGPDGTIWGGEWLLLEDGGRSWRRVAHFEPFELAGGDRAVAEPWRQAYALALRAWDRLPSALEERFERAAGGEDNLEALRIMIRRRVNSPLSSGTGRLFDAAGFIIAGRERVSFEAQAAMEVEALAARCGKATESCPFKVLAPEGLPLRLSPAPAVRDIVERLAAGQSREDTARAFQDGLVSACAGLAARLAQEHSVKDVLLSGGCFQNTALLEGLSSVLEARGLRCYSNREAPVNDGGVALGQVLAAALAGES